MQKSYARESLKKPEDSTTVVNAMLMHRHSESDRSNPNAVVAAAASPISTRRNVGGHAMEQKAPMQPSTPPPPPPSPRFNANGHSQSRTTRKKYFSFMFLQKIIKVIGTAVVIIATINLIRFSTTLSVGGYNDNNDGEDVAYLLLSAEHEHQKGRNNGQQKEKKKKNRKGTIRLGAQSTVGEGKRPMVEMKENETVAKSIQVTSGMGKGRKKRMGIKPRIIYLGESSSSPYSTPPTTDKNSEEKNQNALFHLKLGRTISLYPAEYTDMTQLYPVIDSSDEALLYDGYEMEFRTFPHHESDPDCVPMSEWQTTFHPTCNEFHEHGMRELMTGGVASLLSEKGYWRDAWEVDDVMQDLPGQKREEPWKGKVYDLKHEKSIVLKTFKYGHNMEDAFFELNRVDALAMDMLTASPRVIDIYGFCGMSVMTEFAGDSVSLLADKLRPVGKLKLAFMIAQSVAAVHGIDGGDNVTLVHNDINFSNVVIGRNRKPLLNDFNLAVLQMWNRRTKKPCTFTTHYPNPQWRSPEEQVNSQGTSHKELNEKIDVYALGNIFYRFVVGRGPWRKPDGRSFTREEKDKLAKLKMESGALPPIAKTVPEGKLEDPAMKVLLEAMYACYTFDPNERPTAKDLVMFLYEKIKKLDDKQKG